MTHETKEDALLEKVIIFLVFLAGAVLVYNQFQFAKLSSSLFLNASSFVLILALIGLIGWLFLKKEPIHEEHHVEHAAHSSEHIPKAEKKSLSFHEKLNYSFVSLIAILILFNQFQISQVSPVISGTSSSVSNFVKSVSSPLKLGSGKGGVVIGPQLNQDGRTTKLVEWQTISETPAPTKSTGNPTNDAIATVVPTGTPSYALEGPGAEKIKGASFDDPIASQKIWASLLGSSRFGTANAIQLTSEEQQRWKKLTSVFTCDFCCGGPNSVTTINQCGCAHSFAWQGMAKFFIKYYPQYTDEQILGEMTKWKAIWYPKGMIQDYLVYTGQQPASILTHGGSVGIKQQFAQKGSGNAQETHATATSIDNLPSMQGGC